MNSEKIPVLVIGATGQLGSLITKHCLGQPNLQVNVLVRNPDKDPNLTNEVQKSGGRVIKGDVTNPESLKDCTKDIHTVISALIGDDKTVLEGQKAVLDDALKNGVKRMVPSDFSIEVTKLEEDEHAFLGQRIKFRKHLEGTPIKGLHVWNGIFTETLFYAMSRGLHYFENPDQKIDMTTYDDTARYVAAAVAKPDRVGDLRVHGDQLSINEMAEVYNGVKGKNIKPRNYGTLEALKNMIADFKRKGEFFKAAMMGYQLPMFDGRGKFTRVDNAEFPEVKPLNFEAFIKKYPGKAVFPEESS